MRDVRPCGRSAAKVPGNWPRPLSGPSIPSRPDFKPLYSDDMSVGQDADHRPGALWRRGHHRAEAIRDKFAELEKQGFGKFPICVARLGTASPPIRTPRACRLGATIPVREVRLSAGASSSLSSAVTSTTMPGLPRVPAASSIELSANGKITGFVLAGPSPGQQRVARRVGGRYDHTKVVCSPAERAGQPNNPLERKPWLERVFGP